MELGLVHEAGNPLGPFVMTPVPTSDHQFAWRHRFAAVKFAEPGVDGCSPTLAPSSIVGVAWKPIMPFVGPSSCPVQLATAAFVAAAGPPRAVMNQPVGAE